MIMQCVRWHIFFAHLQSGLAVGGECNDFSCGIGILVVASHDIRTVATDLSFLTRRSWLSIFAHNDDIDAIKRSTTAARLTVVRSVEGNDGRCFGKAITFADGDADIIHKVDDLLGTGSAGHKTMSHIAAEAIANLVEDDGIQDAGLEIFQKAKLGTVALLCLGLLVAKLQRFLDQLLASSAGTFHHVVHTVVNALVQRRDSKECRGLDHGQITIVGHPVLYAEALELVEGALRSMGLPIESVTLSEVDGFVALELQVPGVEDLSAYQTQAELEHPLVRANGLVGLLLKSYRSEMVFEPGLIALRLETPAHPQDI